MNPVLAIKAGKVYRKAPGPRWVKNRRVSYGWLPEHRCVWVEHHGPIPKGYQIRMRDGNLLNCTIDNLFMVGPKDRGEADRLGWPPELLEVIALNNRLKRKLNGEE
jgi:hypothetical protein